MYPNSPERQKRSLTTFLLWNIHAFDPRRSAILLIGGDKTGDGRFYDRYVGLADSLYDDHLDELREEGLIG